MNLGILAKMTYGILDLMSLEGPTAINLIDILGNRAGLKGRKGLEIAIKFRQSVLLRM